MQVNIDRQFETENKFVLTNQVWSIDQEYVSFKHVILRSFVIWYFKVVSSGNSIGLFFKDLVQYPVKSRMRYKQKAG